ncbi:DNA-binding transcriptional LysR family regulator [Agrobacterium larrymoorei]|uniref:DNA-binding transcriptional LysR family regulator n=1 Tax=Agrobacterium larrymoorei TaxID=160699 RepID=A0AAJ2BLE8_9HYPH|nr:LysR substrate-binding domain-containing protein [Agrobacterium larrymoorei]MDR6101735.1 DNA-binding transcriptional LysR family regulator [Agrobacterium larrymoorei]
MQKAHVQSTLSPKPDSDPLKAGEASDTLDLRSIDLNLVVVLGSLLRQQNITLASGSLGLSVPTVVRALTRLRTLFDDELLARYSRSFRLTSLGDRLAPKVESALEDVALIFTSQVPVPEQFSVGMPDYLALVLSTQLSGYFRQVAPTTAFKPAISPNDAICLLEEGALDLALGTFDSAPPGFRCRTLPPVRSLFLTRRGHEARDGSLSEAELRRFPGIRMGPFHHGGIGSFNDGLAAVQHRADQTLNVPDIHTAMQLLQESDAILTLPAPSAEHLALSYDIDVFVPEGSAFPPEYRVSLIWHERWQQDAIHAGVRSLIASRITAGFRHGSAR